MKAKVLVLAVVCLAGLPGWSQVSDQKARLLTLENAWNHAVQTKDSAALELLLGTELVYVDYDGKLRDRAEYLADVGSQLVHPARIVSESMNVHLYGEAAVVDGVYREQGVRNGKPYLLRERFIDTWVRHSENWVCVASSATLLGQ